MLMPTYTWRLSTRVALVSEDIGPSKCWAGDEAPVFVLLMRMHQLHSNPLSQVFYGLPKDRVVHQLV